MSSAAPRAVGAAPANVALLTVCVMLATIMQALDTTIANVALPYMQGSLSATTDQINWVLTSYIVAAAIATPVTGFLEQRLGRKRLFQIAVVGFTVASVLCGIAMSLPEMVLFRVLQGLFGASLVPLSQAVLLDSYPKEKHGSAMAMWGVGVMVGPILGPVIGGWLTEAYNWRWVFYINVPIGILTFFGLSACLSETPVRKGGFDWFGFAMLSLAIGSFQMMLDRGEQLDWFSSTEVVIEAVLAALAFYLFLVQTFTVKNPFIDPAIFKDRNLSVGLCFIFVVGIILLASLALITPYLQNLMGYPVITAGLVLAPRGIGTMLAMMVVGRIINRVDPRALLVLGLLITAEVLWEMTRFTPSVSEATLIRTGVMQGAGLGFMFVPLSTITFATLPSHLRTQGTALYSLMRNIGSSIGISLVIFLLTRNTQLVHAELAGQVTPFNDALGQAGPSHFWNLATTVGKAALNAEVTRQASIIAYANDFKLMMLVALVALPLVLLLKKAKGQPGGAHAAVME
ncbi:MAG: DHA2 family efflux MFS transporter permease subunit [Reyranella sp.]|uniref:DHA2 family efflux MFS transporter permease subunit n=1 Tax=Reyranella sp. TaxID=1929291 RepID=UPI0009635176|nr:DHA2 family efflux MFS transporter permease subunit [Reyranella sp.]MBN9541853.1 DHA2 family efflux MFS transporter permease subunit [Alphaproteobacteria bacterium]MBR2816998.1 DHA2 family efflux MFS transporter permease subunit [Reyranella sp.]OJU43182.1 MAG: EmrB/QacA family drug resistance transporter [Alphaproteobacteria bacterium 65-37]